LTGPPPYVGGYAATVSGAALVKDCQPLIPSPIRWERARVRVLILEKVAAVIIFLSAATNQIKARD